MTAGFFPILSGQIDPGEGAHEEIRVHYSYLSAAVYFI